MSEPPIFDNVDNTVKHHALTADELADMLVKFLESEEFVPPVSHKQGDLIEALAKATTYDILSKLAQFLRSKE